MNVMVAGGAGYIGSHAVKMLFEAGHRVVAVDNLFAAIARRCILRWHFIRPIWPRPAKWPISWNATRSTA